MRGELGSTQIRLTSALSTALSAREDLSAAESRIRDADGVSELSQGEPEPNLALRLLGG